VYVSAAMSQTERLFPDQVAGGIDALLEMDALSPEVKADILCNNAMRFLRLPASVCVP